MTLDTSGPPETRTSVARGSSARRLRWGRGVISALAATAASVCLAPGHAAAAPASPFQVEQVLLTGTPWPVSYQSLTATTISPGVARVSITRLCNAVNRPLCLPSTNGAQISWHNHSTGRSGVASIPYGAPPGSHSDLRTGPGVVSAHVSTVGMAYTLVPGFGVFTVR